jgi:hypothetical protein
MMVSSTKKDIGYELSEAEIDGLSDLYFPQEDKDSPVRESVRKSFLPVSAVTIVAAQLI